MSSLASCDSGLHSEVNRRSAPHSWATSGRGDTSSRGAHGCWLCNQKSRRASGRVDLPTCCVAGGRHTVVLCSTSAAQCYLLPLHTSTRLVAAASYKYASSSALENVYSKRSAAPTHTRCTAVGTVAHSTACNTPRKNALKKRYATHGSDKVTTDHRAHRHKIRHRHNRRTRSTKTASPNHRCLLNTTACTHSFDSVSQTSPTCTADSPRSPD